MNEYEEKKKARIDRYREMAEKAHEESEDLMHRAGIMSSVIPAGQPVHGPADRHYRENIGEALDRSIKAEQKAKYYERKAKAAENNRAISSDDPEALSKLRAKLSSLQEAQNRMKFVNAYYRKHHTCRGCEGLSTETAARMDELIANSAYSWEKVPYSSYVLSNRNAEIRRISARIKQLEEAQSLGFQGWEFEGGKVETNMDINRLQIFFDEIPSENVRQELKGRGFHWSRKEGAWQRQLTDNAVSAASRIAAILPKDGSDPRKLQPKQEPKEKER